MPDLVENLYDNKNYQIVKTDEVPSGGDIRDGTSQYKHFYSKIKTRQ